MQEFTGKEYLKIDIANSFGHDKLNWNERIEWFDLNEVKLDSLIRQAEKPALFYAGVMAWRDVQDGKPSGYPISLDACASGLQLLSCLTGDAQAAKLCGVISTGSREDAYTSIYQWMCNRIGSTSRIKREDTKKAIMTSLYGSTAEPENIFGGGELLATFFEAMEVNAPGCWELNRMFLDIWDPQAQEHNWVLPDNFHVHVKVMVNRTEVVHFYDAPYETTRKIQGSKWKGRSLGANTIHSVDGLVVREMVRRCDYDVMDVIRATEAAVKAGTDTPDIHATATSQQSKMVQTMWNHYRETGFLSARILPYINEETIHRVARGPLLDLLLSTPQKPFKLLTVHDCFRCLPNYGNDLRKQYRQVLSELARSELCSSLFSQILKRKVTIGKMDPQMWKQVQDSNYALS